MDCTLALRMRGRSSRRCHDPASPASNSLPFSERAAMQWTKPEFEVVDVTMEVTAYVARR
jgi:coenzyme PQQ precursor peptide PqqA